MCICLVWLDSRHSLQFFDYVCLTSRSLAISCSFYPPVQCACDFSPKTPIPYFHFNARTRQNRQNSTHTHISFAVRLNFSIVLFCINAAFTVVAAAVVAYTLFPSALFRSLTRSLSLLSVLTRVFNVGNVLFYSLPSIFMHVQCTTGWLGLVQFDCLIRFYVPNESTETDQVPASL